MSTDVDDNCPAHLILIAKTQPSLNIPKIIHLNKPEITVGRLDQDVFLDSSIFPQIISRKHAVIKQTEVTDDSGRKKWSVVDTKSLNGVYINSMRVNESNLEDGDVIIFGGKGVVPVGQKKEQWESEFIYRFRWRTNNIKRKSDSMSEGAEKSEEIEIENKKKKSDDEEKTKLLEELKNKDRDLEEKERRLKELMDQLEAKEKLMQEQQEKELTLAKQNETFHEQLINVQNQFETEKKQLEDEKLRIYSETQKQTLEVEEQRKLIETRLLEQQKKLEEIEKRTLIDKQDLEEELACTICQELILQAMTLECSHSFCSSCIRDWLERKKQCPVCRQPINKAPVRSRAIDNAISKIAEKLSPKEKQEWDERNKNLTKKAEEEIMVKKLQELIRTARTRNLRFLSILEVWNPDEKRIFHDGVNRYTGRARAVYCESVGLSQQFITNTSVATLRQAAQNIGINSPELLLNTQELRKSLLSFTTQGS